MNGALITTEMSGEEGEGVCIYSLLLEISNQRGSILGELTMRFFCASKEGACTGFSQFCFFFKPRSSKILENEFMALLLSCFCCSLLTQARHFR